MVGWAARYPGRRHPRLYTHMREPRTGGCCGPLNTCSGIYFEMFWRAIFRSGSAMPQAMRATCCVGLGGALGRGPAGFPLSIAICHSRRDLGLADSDGANSMREGRDRDFRARLLYAGERRGDPPSSLRGDGFSNSSEGGYACWKLGERGGPAASSLMAAEEKSGFAGGDSAGSAGGA